MIYNLFSQFKCFRCKFIYNYKLNQLVDEESETTVIIFDDGILFQELKKMQEFDFTNFGIDVDKYLKTCIRVQKRLLKPIKKVHYLISLDINSNDKIINLIERRKRIEGVEVESTTN